MMIQDYIFMFGAFVFGILLLPILLDNNSKVPWYSSLPTALMLYVFSANFFSLEMWLSGIGNLVTAFMWSLVFVYRR